MTFNVYILQSERNGSYYIGHTEDIQTRLDQHNRGKVKSTRALRPLRIAYTENYRSRLEAVARELYLKSLKSRRAIQDLIRQADR